MEVMKKVTFYYNRDLYEGSSEIVKVDDDMKDIDIVKNIISEITKTPKKHIDFFEGYFIDGFDGVIYSFDIKYLHVIDLTEKE